MPKATTQHPAHRLSDLFQQLLAGHKKHWRLKVRVSDPEYREMVNDQNAKRAGWAREACQAFRVATGCDNDTVIRDLLCDLMHLCEQEPNYGDFYVELKAANRHFIEEHAEM